MFTIPKIMRSAAVVLLILVTSAHAHVELHAPRRGATLEVGATYTLAWRITIRHNFANWDLWYSTTSPDGPWTPIKFDLFPLGSTAVGSVHAYSWTVPAKAASDQVWARVRMDSPHADYEDVSARFRVVDTRPAPTFKRGDADGLNGLQLTDGLFTLNFLFLGGPKPPCLDAADTDDSGEVDISDVLVVFNSLFSSGPEPPAPGPTVCGPDPTTDDNLDCAESSACE